MMPTLLGLGQDAPSPVDAFLLQHPMPTGTHVASFLKAFDAATRPAVAQELNARGVDSESVASGLNWLQTGSKLRAAWPTIAGVLTLTSASASAYHGYRRNQSIPWAIWWFLMGSVFPVFTPIIGVAQGFGKRKER